LSTLVGALGALLLSFLTAAFLLVALLPATIVVGGAVFLPHTREYWSWKRIRTVATRHRAIIGCMIGIVAVFVLVHALEDAIAPYLHADYTQAIGGIDGDLQASLQAALPGWGAFGLAFVYLLGFPILVYLTPFLSIWRDDGRTAWRAFAAYALVYAFAVPFYLFFPVREVWTVKPGVHNLALVYPWVKGLLYSFNGTANDFPSEHTAMAVAVAYVAWRASDRRFAWFAVADATLVAASTILLGIHWTLDVLAGLVVALVAVVLVDRWLPVEAKTKPAARRPSAAPDPVALPHAK
jgi:membrane-associated phospholipid phosphatase